MRTDRMMESPIASLVLRGGAQVASAAEEGRK
jgi:hypothetical protein